MSKSFNVIITTVNRATLNNTIQSILPQLDHIDYLTIIVDSGDIKPELTENAKCTVRWIKNSEPLGFFGHGSRNKWQRFLPGDFHMNGDDDDTFAENAMEIIRHNCKTPRLHIFKMVRNEVEIWGEKEIYYGNIGTPCGVYPPINLPDWNSV